MTIPTQPEREISRIGEGQALPANEHLRAAQFTADNLPLFQRSGSGKDSDQSIQVATAGSTWLLPLEIQSRGAAKPAAAHTDSHAVTRTETDKSARDLPTRSQPGGDQGKDFEGVMSWYGNSLNGSLMANGDRFNENAYTCAHRTLPKGTILDITANGKTVRAEVTDRGPYVKGRSLDVSHRIAQDLGFENAGLSHYTAHVVSLGNNAYHSHPEQQHHHQHHHRRHR
jgi:rare lipoprotein A